MSLTVQEKKQDIDREVQLIEEKKRILNVDILSITSEELLKKMWRGMLVTVNADILIKLQEDREYYDIVKNAEWVVCDSRILSHAAKYLGTPLKEVIPGSSFFPQFYKYHKNSKDVTIFLLGAAEGVAANAQVKINNKIGRKMVVGSYSPPFGFENDSNECQKIVHIIEQSGANVLVVGLGAPKQEKWIAKYREHLPSINLFMGLGATIDFEAEHVKRAPKFIQKLSLEWLFRLLTEPRRLWKRYLVDDLPIFTYIRRQKRGEYKNPFE